MCADLKPPMLFAHASNVKPRMALLMLNTTPAVCSDQAHTANHITYVSVAASRVQRAKYPGMGCSRTTWASARPGTLGAGS